VTEKGLFAPHIFTVKRPVKTFPDKFYALQLLLATKQGDQVKLTAMSSAEPQIRVPQFDRFAEKTV